MEDGYIYCFSNASMPGILKIGMTERTPDIRLGEANASDTWRPPSPYNLEFAKKVTNPKQKESALHKLFSRYTDRVNPNREFFRILLEEVNVFFDLIDGEMWVETHKEEEKNVVIHSRDMSKCFTNGQLIRHTIVINKTWIGIYDSLQNGIIYNTKIYKSLSGFSGAHYSTDRPDRTSSSNGWQECECEVNGNWVSTFKL